jgi:hypothetical protein
MIRTTITTQGLPSADAGSGLRARFQRTMLEGLHSAIDPMLDEVRSQTPYDSIRSAYGTQDLVTGNGVQVSVTNTSPIWPFRESDTRPHWVPFGPGTSLAAWANARNIPPFLVSRKIARDGTKGNYILSRTTNAYRPRIDQAIQAALYTFVIEGLKGGA